MPAGTNPEGPCPDDRTLTPEDLRAISHEISSSYPPPRLGTELVLLEINPHRAHAYWNVDVADYRRALAACGDPNPPLLLRIHDVTGIPFDGTNSVSFFDLQVQGLQGHWYVDLWKDGRTFIGELGLRRSDGRLEILARSNPVSTPIASESAHYHTEAVNLAASDPNARITDLTAPHGQERSEAQENANAADEPIYDPNPPPLTIVPPPDPEAFRAPDVEEEPADLETADILPLRPPETSDTPEPLRKEFPLPAGAGPRPVTYPDTDAPPRESDFPAPPEIAQHSAAAEPRLEETAEQPPSRTAESDAVSAQMEASRVGGAVASETPAYEERPDWPTAEQLLRFVREAAGAHEGTAAPQSETLMGRFAVIPDHRRDAHGQDAPGESAPEHSTSDASQTQPAPAQFGATVTAPPEPQASQPVVPPAPSPANVGGGNGSFPPGPPGSVPLENYVSLFSAEHGSPQVALEVNVELHIYGRVKPGMELTFYGQRVPIRPDGSFSIRKPLPHGAVVLPLLAIETPKPSSFIPSDDTESADA